MEIHEVIIVEFYYFVSKPSRVHNHLSPNMILPQDSGSRKTGVDRTLEPVQ